MTVSVVDYGLGNLGSVENMLKRVGAQSRRVSTPDELLASDSLLLPGIGAFDSGMRRLDDLGLTEPIRAFAATGKPLLGICLGMQLLLDSSEEGEMGGLGLIGGRSVRFPADAGIRVPHMGWSRVTMTHDDPLVSGLEPENRFYFVHSYCVETDDEDAVLGRTHYGRDFTSMVRSANVMGAQFHPEKSHHFGMTIMQNFAGL